MIKNLIVGRNLCIKNMEARQISFIVRTNGQRQRRQSRNETIIYAKPACMIWMARESDIQQTHWKYII